MSRQCLTADKVGAIMVSKTQLERALHNALNDARDCNKGQTGSGWGGRTDSSVPQQVQLDDSQGIS